MTTKWLFQDELYLYGQISTNNGEEFEIATLNSARSFVLWTKIDQGAFEDGGGYGEEEDEEEDVEGRLQLDMKELLRRGKMDTTTRVNITITVHFTKKFGWVIVNLQHDMLWQNLSASWQLHHSPSSSKWLPLPTRASRTGFASMGFSQYQNSQFKSFQNQQILIFLVGSQFSCFSIVLLSLRC